jgi:two-component system cell cycle response regulator
VVKARRQNGTIMARILVIEDNPTNLQLAMYLLQALGHDVTGTKEGSEGIDMARQHQPDLILLDIHMPKMDGYEVARRLRDDPQCRHIPIVGVTALAMVGDREKLLSCGFDGYISKPIDPETFVGKVQTFLRLPPPAGQSSPRQPASAVEEQGSQMPGAKRGVFLFVDNSPTNLQLAHSILGPQGYEVITAPNVQEGMDLARRSKPDLIVSDVHMPHQDGYDLIRMVQADPDLRQTPFVFLSSTTSSVREQERALAQGATRFLCRPLDAQTLLDELEACLRSPASD